MIDLKVCNTPSEQKIFRETINKHHSYIKHKRTPTRRIHFLVYESESKNLIGAVGLNSATLNLAARDKFLNFKNKKEKLKNINKIANNYRFALIKENITIKNAGSQVLKALRQKGAAEWKKRYGDDLIGIETFVKPPWDGAVYKADNWKYLGETSGFSLKRLPLKLIKKEHRTKQISLFKKRNKTNRLVAEEKVTKKHIFYISIK